MESAPDLTTRRHAPGDPLPAPLRALLRGAVDYAGLFPPAGLEMEPAVRNYAEYRAGDDAWALGRFVVPVARLEEFARVADPYLPPAPEAGVGGDRARSAPAEDPASGHGAAAPWSLSALVGADPAGDARRIEQFNAAFRGRAAIDSVELKAETAEQVALAAGAMPDSVEVYVEIRIDDDPRPLIEAIRRAGACAKVRTGGVEEALFPAPTLLARFLARCVEAGVRFKATAGLHHPLRARYPVSYEPGCGQAVMYGYANVVLAAALLRAGASEAEARAALEETDPAALRPEADALAWRGHRIPAAALAEARREGMTGFGSCSFREPVDELARLATS